MTIILQATSKCWLVRCVGLTYWYELAAWSTAKSGLKGWRWQHTDVGVDGLPRDGFGRRLITPWIGVALWLGR